MSFAEAGGVGLGAGGCPAVGVFEQDNAMKKTTQICE